MRSNAAPFSVPRNYTPRGHLMAPVFCGQRGIVASDGEPANNIVRVRSFVDFWNFQLSIDDWAKEYSASSGGDWRLDWKQLGPWLAEHATSLLASTDPSLKPSYDGLNVYASYNPKASQDRSLKHWLTSVVDRFPGVEVELKERKAKGPPTCPACYEPIGVCPHCDAKMERTVEKGIDTAIVTDMIRHAWEDAFDVAVLVSSDRDFIPAVEFLNKKGKKVINGWFGKRGYDLARKCWANIDLSKILPEVGRKA